MGEQRVSGTNSDYWKVSFSVLLVMMCFIAGMLFVGAPFQANNWIKLPFPGFLIEQTMLIGSHSGATWDTRDRIHELQRVISINDQPIGTPVDYRRILSQFAPGDMIKVVVSGEDGSRATFERVPLARFPSLDFLRLFWLPYGIGIIYFILGVGVYIRRGHIPSGQAFAYFCISISISTVLLFDLVSTHIWVGFWSTGISQLGGAAIILALTFPEPLSVLQRRSWLIGIPLALTLGISVWCMVVNYDLAHPWDYVYAWRSSFLYAVIGVLIFFSLLLYRLKRSSSPEETQQLRITLWGGFFAFTPALIWLASPFIGEQIIWDPGLFLPLMMIFPMAVGAAIVRYRLWDLEIIINRTLVYSALTLILSGIFILSILGSQLLLMGLLQRATLVSVALSSIISTLLFNPLRMRIQNFVDQRFFRHKYDVAQALVSFQGKVRDTIELDVLKTGLVAVISETMEPTTVTLCTCDTGNDANHFFIEEDDPLRQVLLTTQDVVEVNKLAVHSPALQQLRRDKYTKTIPLVSQGELIGVVNLGPKRSGQAYTMDDRRLLMILAAQVAPALRIANLVRQYQGKVIEQERMRQELEVARLIQQSLLPKELPQLPGWEIAVHYQPARAVGGDFYDFFLNEDELVIVIGDVTDKGVPAALVMATTRSILRGTSRRKLSPGAALKQANDILVPEMFKSMFVTCFYLILNYRTGKVIFANAGHNLPIHRTDGGVVEFYATGMPLGLMYNMIYDEKETTIKHGDSVLLYSDGLVEAHNSDFEMFGEKNLEAIVKLITAPKDLINSLNSAVQNYSGRIDDPEDDITLLCIHRRCAM
jgi:serine phosphatase RsbU (regulator of sigma subunit)